jgi:hypothetical protein
LGKREWWGLLSLILPLKGQSFVDAMTILAAKNGTLDVFSSVRRILDNSLSPSSIPDCEVQISRMQKAQGISGVEI